MVITQALKLTLSNISTPGIVTEMRRRWQVLKAVYGKQLQNKG